MLWTLVRLDWMGSKGQPEGWQELLVQPLGEEEAECTPRTG